MEGVIDRREVLNLWLDGLIDELLDVRVDLKRLHAEAKEVRDPLFCVLLSRLHREAGDVATLRQFDLRRIGQESSDERKPLKGYAQDTINDSVCSLVEVVSSRVALNWVSGLSDVRRQGLELSFASQERLVWTLEGFLRLNVILLNQR